MRSIRIYPLQIRHAAEALAVILKDKRPADVTLNGYFRGNPKLGRGDRAFIAEAVFAVLRNWRALQWLAGADQPRRLLLAWLVHQRDVRGDALERLLLAGEEEWVRRLLRMPTRDMPAAARVNLPDWLIERLRAQQDDAAVQAFGAAAARPAPLDLRVNALLTDRGQVQAQLARDGIKAAMTPYSPLGLRLDGRVALYRHPLFLQGRIEVQDEGSQLLGWLVAPRPSEMVVDFCAGAGGKTLLLGMLMQSRGRLHAFDVSAARLEQFKPRLRRSGLSNVHPRALRDEADPILKRLRGQADRVLVDAPCSGTGTLRRNPLVKWRLTPDDVRELAEKQRRIMASAARLVRPGGRLVYATCSVLRAENEEVVAAFLRQCPEFQTLDCGAILKEQGIPLEMGSFLRLDTATHGTDCFFAAAFERKPD